MEVLRTIPTTDDNEGRNERGYHTCDDGDKNIRTGNSQLLGFDARHIVGLGRIRFGIRSPFLPTVAVLP